MRRRDFSAGFALGGLAISLPACSTAATAAPLKALTADDFRASRQRGVGFGLLQAGERSSTDLDALQALGAGHIRIWVEPERDPTRRDGYRIPPQQLAVLEIMLTQLERRGIYTVLACSLGADARGELWGNESLQASAVSIWQQLARQLHGRAAIAGFDIVNEPVPPGLTFALRQRHWLEFATRVVVAVRAIDPHRVLIVESAPDATGASFDTMRPLPFDGLVYSMHSYAPFEFTHQNVMPELARARSYAQPGPDGRLPAQALQESLQPVVQFGRQFGVPIYIGEFSAPRWAPDNSAAAYISDSIAQFNRHGWSWTYHEFRTWHGWDPEMASTQQGDMTRSSDAPVIRAVRTGLLPRGG